MYKEIRQQRPGAADIPLTISSSSLLVGRLVGALLSVEYFDR